MSGSGHQNGTRVVLECPEVEQGVQNEFGAKVNMTLPQGSPMEESPSSFLA